MHDPDGDLQCDLRGDARGDPHGDRHRITDPAALAELYGEPSSASIRKETDRLNAPYRALVEASPFVVLATCGAGGLDASPRGDPAGFVVVQDEHTLLLPDRRGNNRIDSLLNVLEDPRVALLFMVPGLNETLRINGRAHITTAPALLERLAMGDKPPRSVLVVRIDTVYFQCSRALLRSALWDPARRVPRESLPSSGDMLAALTGGEIGGPAYDAAQPERVAASLY